jgi:hypothetical protein
VGYGPVAVDKPVKKSGFAHIGAAQKRYFRNLRPVKGIKARGMQRVVPAGWVNHGVLAHEKY